MVNFIDGLDGLAAGVCAISALTFAVIALSLDRGTTGRGGRHPGGRRLRLLALQLLPGQHLHGRRRRHAARLRARRDQHPGRAQGRRDRRPDLSVARAGRALRRPLPGRHQAPAQGGAHLLAGSRPRAPRPRARRRLLATHVGAAPLRLVPAAERAGAGHALPRHGGDRRAGPRGAGGDRLDGAPAAALPRERRARPAKEAGPPSGRGGPTRRARGALGSPPGGGLSPARQPPRAPPAARAAAERRPCPSRRHVELVPSTAAACGAAGRAAGV